MRRFCDELTVWLLMGPVSFLLVRDAYASVIMNLDYLCTVDFLKVWLIWTGAEWWEDPWSLHEIMGIWCPWQSSKPEFSNIFTRPAPSFVIHFSERCWWYTFTSQETRKVSVAWLFSQTTPRGMIFVWKLYYIHMSGVYVYHVNKFWQD